jgi:hypothetical protein
MRIGTGTRKATLGSVDPSIALDQDDFWLNQPKIINLIAFKVIEQLYGFA